MKSNIFFIYKGTSNFCQELVMDSDYETFVRQNPEGFYDIVSTKDTIQNGIKVIEYSEYEKLQKQLNVALEALEEVAIEQKYYVPSADYFTEVVRLNLTASEAISDILNLEIRNNK